MPRRLLAVAIAGALALAGAAACRSQPTVAAYVGDAQLTNAQVEQIFHEFKDPQIQQQHAGDIREIVVSDFVLTEVGRRIATEHGITVQAPDLSRYQDTAQGDGVPLDSGFIRSLAGADATMAALASIVTPQAPSEADQREVYEIIQAEAQRVGQAIPPFEQVQSQIDSPQMRSAFGIRPLVRDAVKNYQVVVNPRYQPIGIPVPFTLGQLTTQLVVPLQSGASPAVVDVSAAPQS
jgi:hypothetical protein